MYKRNDLVAHLDYPDLGTGRVQVFDTNTNRALVKFDLDQRWVHENELQRVRTAHADDDEDGRALWEACDLVSQALTGQHRLLFEDLTAVLARSILYGLVDDGLLLRRWLATREPAA